jgi:hypothetical protein
MTDGSGMATVALFSSTPGFATVQAEVGSGAVNVRDKKTVYFSVFDFRIPGQATVPTLTLAVDSNNDGTYNDPSDFFLSSGEAIVRATVLDGSGAPVANDTVMFAADSTEVTFPDGDSKVTNSDGQAFVRIKVVPSEARNFNTPVNISALSITTGAANVLTLFVTPIEVGQLAVIAQPPTVASGGSSTISATALTTTGSLVPDGTIVNFTASSGVVEPFAQTTDGIATAAFTAPTLAAGSGGRNVTLTASAGGKQATTTVVVTAPPAPTPPPTPTPTPVPALAVTPPGGSMPCGGASQNFFVTGGTPPYSATAPLSTAPVTITNSPVQSSGGFFTVTTKDCGTLPASTPVSILVIDHTSKIVTVTVTVTNP